MEPDPLSPYNQSNRSQYGSPSGQAAFRIDEGFSEEVSSQDDSNRYALEHLQEWIMSQHESTRMDIAYEILRTLRTSNIAAVVDRLTPLLHMDPLEKLPPEITAEIFTYLDAPTLLTASLASHNWRSRIQDSRLWQKLYLSQGWEIATRELQAAEESMSLVRTNFKSRRGKSRASDSGPPQMKKRATSDWLGSRERQLSAGLPNWGEQHSTIEGDTDANDDSSDHEMIDAPASIHSSPQRPNKRHSQDSSDEMDYYPAHSGSTLAEVGTGKAASSRNMKQPFKPRLTMFDQNGEERLNWAYLYKQRQRLEENWAKGKFNNFQLPDPAYPQEAHTECVYCIQFHGKWLVSGSRDKSLRIWDLETRRLRGRPLTGHSQSVLCLQFDPTEGEDVIISGSSDASVIVWRFSTGQKLHEIPSAHEESVLNLRFDKRYLVTCSKDKKIKVWNRNSLTPTDPDFPKLKSGNDTTLRVPSYIIDVANTEPSLLEAKLANGTIKGLKAYTHLMTFTGHSAAVNAIQINGDIVVSASGDRLIKVWNVANGKMLRSMPGHMKGIACVQFDSRRIVSGSSDNTVRLFDAFTGSEVAVLKGHTNLVRTVQAGFGDLPGSVDDDLIKARSAQYNFAKDVEEGRVTDDRNFSKRLRNGELGSSRVAFGARLPPGGGGSKWGKIVSGSYDESIIIWRKNAQGDWVVGQTLRQDAAVRATRAEQAQHAAANAVPLPPVQAPPAPPVPAHPSAPAPRTQATSNHNRDPSMTGESAATATSSLNANAVAIMQQAMNNPLATLGAGLSNVVGIARSMNVVPPRLSSGTATSQSSSSTGAASSLRPVVLSSNLQGSVNLSMTQFGQQSQSSFHQQATTSQASSQSHGQSQTPPSTIQPQSQQSQTQFPATPTAQQQAAHPTQPPPLVPATATVPNPPPAPYQLAQLAANNNAQQNHHQHPHAHAQNQNQQNNVSVSRVFKLQFDARRIVCCSQDSRIIGWDFANGDPEIMESAKFFLGP